MSQHGFEHIARFFAHAGQVQCFDQPKGADVECCFGCPEIIFSSISQHVIPAPQFTFHSLECGEKPLIIGFQITQFDHLEQAGVETTLHRYDGMPHMFFQLSVVTDAGKELLAEAAAALKSALA